MDAPYVDIAIACNYMQHYEWWSAVFANILYEVQHGYIRIGKIYASGSAVADNAKNRLTGAWSVDPKRLNATDINRNTLVGVTANGDKLPDGFMSSSDAEWVFWIDDDTVPPKGAITRLLELRRELVGGLYFRDGAPYPPLAYVRREGGFYSPLYNYTPGTLTRVDGIGMGCTLIHKNVYEKIANAHELFQRPNASLLPIRKNLVIEGGTPIVDEPTVINDMLVMPLTRPRPDDNRPWPFYAMEYGRTEDLHFGELCANAGVDIYVDTTITCDHWKTKAVTYQTYREHLDERAEEEITNP